MRTNKVVISPGTIIGVVGNAYSWKKDTSVF